jgi:ABC-type microcin C transport system permease subunit YejE
VSIQRILERPFLYRADLAILLNLSTESIRTNESRLGLDAARRDINARLIRYDTRIAVQQLLLRGQLPTMAVG